MAVTGKDHLAAQYRRAVSSGAIAFRSEVGKVVTSDEGLVEIVAGGPCRLLLDPRDGSLVMSCPADLLPGMIQAAHDAGREDALKATLPPEPTTPVPTATE